MRTTLLSLLLLALSAGCTHPEAPPADGRTPIRVALVMINTGQVGFYEWAEAEYEQRRPDIDIIIEQFPGTSLKDYEIKLRLQYASGQAPDIWSFRENELAPYVELGLLAPAPASIQALVESNSINDMVQQAPFFNGVCYGITQHAGWQILYYNKTHFREAGLTDPPTTWPALIDYARRLAQYAPDGRLTRAGLSLRKTGYKQGTAEKWLTFFYSAGGMPFNEDGTESLFDSPAGHAAFNLYGTILAENLDTTEHEGDQRGFGQGHVAMFIREDHVIAWLNEHYPNLEYGVAALPALDSTMTSFSSGGAFPMVVSSTSNHQNEAWAFLSFLFEDDVYLRYIRAVQAQPLLTSIAQRDEFISHPQLSTYARQAVYVPPKFPHDRNSLEIIGTYVERFVYGRISAEEALRRMDEEITRQLQLNASSIN